MSFHLKWHGKSFFFSHFRRFLAKNFVCSEKSRTFVATIPTTPLNNAYHGGTSFLYKVKILNDGNIYK